MHAPAGVRSRFGNLCPYLNGIAYSTGLSQVCKGCRPVAQSETQDANGNVATRTDFNEYVTIYVYDPSYNAAGGADP
jgi:hypothetical protein